MVVVDINGEAAEAVAAQIDGSGGAGVALRADVTDKADVEAMMRAALDSYGRLDVLVNNAGVSHRNKPMSEVTRDGVRPDLRGQREGDLPGGARAAIPADAGPGRRLHHQHQLHRGDTAAPRA